MSVFYRKYQNKNRQSVAYGKWFARAVTIGKTINIDELAKHMSEHNTPYSKGAIKGVLTDMIGCVRELMLEGKAVKLEGLAIFSAGIKTKKNGAPTSAEFSTTKHIDSVYMRARATGEFTRQELTKAGNVTELPKNYTDYHEEDDEPQNPSGGSGSQSGSGTGSVTPSGNGSSQSGGDNGGSQNGGNSDSGNTNGGSQSGNSGSGSNTGDSTGGNTSGDGQQSTYNLTIARSGSGTSTVTDDSENVITGQRSFAPGTNLNIEIVPAEGQVPTATINGSSIELTENDGTYTGSFQMPAQVSVLELNSGSNGGDDYDPHNPIDSGN
jgi:nucleoid DNA-binding protein